MRFDLFFYGSGETGSVVELTETLFFFHEELSDPRELLVKFHRFFFCRF